MPHGLLSSSAVPDLLAHFPDGYTPRPEQVRLLAGLADALHEIEEDRRAPRVLLVEAPPGVGKSHVAMALARWSGDAYLLTSQRHLQDQYEREFGADLALVKGRDNYLCERYPGAQVPTSRGLCRRVRWHGRSVRAVNPLATPDSALLAAIARGEHLLHGFRNRDLVRLGTAGAPAAVTQQLRLLRAHEVIRKVPRTHRYLVTDRGRVVVAAVLAARQADVATLMQAA